MTDNLGLTAVASTSVALRNLLPAAGLRVAPGSVAVGQRVTLDASDSGDHDGSLVLYRFDLDGDGAAELTSTARWSGGGTRTRGPSPRACWCSTSSAARPSPRPRCGYAAPAAEAAAGPGPAAAGSSSGWAARRASSGGTSPRAARGSPPRATGWRRAAHGLRAQADAERLKLSRRPRGAMRIGSARLRVRPGRAGTLSVRLSARGKRALKRIGRAGVRVTVRGTVRDGARRTVTVSRSVLVRR